MISAEFIQHQFIKEKRMSKPKDKMETETVRERETIKGYRVKYNINGGKIRQGKRSGVNLR